MCFCIPAVHTFKAHKFVEALQSMFHFSLTAYPAPANCLQVRDSASSVAAPARAAQEKEAAAKQARRNKFVATGPVRKSSRAGAVQTAARLQAQAEALSSDDELAASPNTLDEASDDEDVAEASDTSNAGRKRKRGSPEEEFDPAGGIVHSMLSMAILQLLHA